MPKEKSSAAPAGAKDGQREPRQLVPIRVAQLEFDPENPRLAKEIASGGEPAVLKWMLNHGNVVELMNSIGEQGYFEGEPLVILPVSLAAVASAQAKRGTNSGKGTEKYFVVEGNRRLAATKLLAQPSLAPVRETAVEAAAAAAKHKPNVLPCLVIERREDVLHFLAYRHVTGIQAWEPLQKARYLKQLAVTPRFRKMSRDELRRHLAREIGTTRVYVARLLAGLAVYEAMAAKDFFGMEGLEDEKRWYSVLNTAISSYKGIAKFIGLGSGTDEDASRLKNKEFEELARWLFEKTSTGKARVPESRGLRLLNKIVESPAALKRFRGGSTLQEAHLLTEGPVEAFREALGEAKSRLELARDVMSSVETFTSEDTAQADLVARLARQVAAATIDASGGEH